MDYRGYLNAGRYAVRHPRRGVVMARKLVTRHTESDDGNAASLRWLEAQAVDAAEIAAAYDAGLWAEALSFGRRLRGRAEPILRAIDYDIGAGGAYEFLYWLTRFKRPRVVVETGVSAGWTTQAFLEAMAVNGDGVLYSSDFPYFRTRQPEDLIGCLVEPRLRDRWTLMIDGDRLNLLRILAQAGSVDLFHYDSDKSYAGREMAVRMVAPHLTPGLIVMDDVRNNSWFYDEATHATVPHRVLGRGGRYGLLGEI